MISVIRNNMCCLARGDSTDQEMANFKVRCLQKRQRVRQPFKRGGKVNFRYVTTTTRFFTEERGRLYFPRGLFDIADPLIKDSMTVIDKSTNDFPVTLDDLGSIEDILRPDASFSLRDDQVMSIRKSLLLRRGIIQLPTGSGKTEVMSGMIKKLEELYPKIKILVIEPTDILVNKTSQRFNRYHLNSEVYHKVRGKDREAVNVVVSNPIALVNDCGKDPHALSDFNAVFWDECQHCKCDTWKSLNMHLINVEYSIGLSALAVNDSRIRETDLDKLTEDEIMIIGSTGKVIMHVSPKHYIEEGILATPVIFQLANRFDKSFHEEYGNDWAKLRVEGIEGDKRNSMVSRVSAMFAKHGRKTLILVGTKNQAEVLSGLLSKDENISSDTCVSYGGGESFTLDGEGGFIPYEGDILEDFDNDKFKVLISTSHMDEGVDLKNLDVAVLASGGKKDRRIIQRIGRALRVNKTGKYAYIVDFFDGDHGVLEQHSRARMKLFEEVVRVPEDLIFKRLNIDDVEAQFLRLES